MLSVVPVAGWATTALLAFYALTLHRRLHQHRHDPLTGLPTRSHFYRRAARRIRRDPQATVALLDLDGFKALNDTHGHPAGDYALTEVATRLRHHFAGLDPLLCRLGGDEFAVVYSQHTHLVKPNLLTLAESLSTPLTLPEPLGGYRVHMGASIGAAHLSDVDSQPSLSAALHHADGLMYRAKRAKMTHDRRVVYERPVQLRPLETTQPVARQRIHGPCRALLRTVARQVTSRV